MRRQKGESSRIEPEDDNATLQMAEIVTLMSLKKRIQLKHLLPLLRLTKMYWNSKHEIWNMFG